MLYHSFGERHITALSVAVCGNRITLRGTSWLPRGHARWFAILPSWKSDGACCGSTDLERAVFTSAWLLLNLSTIPGVHLWSDRGIFAIVPNVRGVIAIFVVTGHTVFSLDCGMLWMRYQAKGRFASVFVAACSAERAFRSFAKLYGQ